MELREKRWYSLNIKYFPIIFLGSVKIPRNNSSQCSRYSGKNLNQDFTTATFGLQILLKSLIPKKQYHADGKKSPLRKSLLSLVYMVQLKQTTFYATFITER